MKLTPPTKWTVGHRVRQGIEIVGPAKEPIATVFGETIAEAAFYARYVAAAPEAIAVLRLLVVDSSGKRDRTMALGIATDAARAVLHQVGAPPPESEAIGLGAFQFW
jgi:hypothetical protein